MKHCSILTLLAFSFLSLVGQEKPTTLILGDNITKNCSPSLVQQFEILKDLLENCPDDDNEPIDLRVYKCNPQTMNVLFDYIAVEDEDKEIFFSRVPDATLIGALEAANKLALSNNNNQHSLLITAALNRPDVYKKTILEPPYQPFAAIEPTRKALAVIALQLHKKNFWYSPFEDLEEKYPGLIKQGMFLPHLSIQDFIDHKMAKIDDRGELILPKKNLNSLHGLNSLPNLSQLRRLDLSENQLTCLNPHIFDTLFQLQELILGGNKLIRLDPDIFNKLPQLKTLTLHKNQLTHLDPDIFDKLTQLKLLSLCNNQLTNLDPHIFDKLTQLQILWLYGNPFAKNKEQRKKIDAQIKIKHPDIKMICWDDLN